MDDGWWMMDHGWWMSDVFNGFNEFYGFYVPRHGLAGLPRKLEDDSDVEVGQRHAQLAGIAVELERNVMVAKLYVYVAELVLHDGALGPAAEAGLPALLRLHQLLPKLKEVALSDGGFECHGVVEAQLVQLRRS